MTNKRIISKLMTRNSLEILQYNNKSENKWNGVEDLVCTYRKYILYKIIAVFAEFY